eukprot:CAMPEP_0115882888 /NCGR_PEP_ID=MMETSP0287-20121206/29250_1 /TAXON_ID=412157 /ORGANISM="Chrysochromulina rotalis, Strain UIO044" /LENGTH=50 /DNA_ID=CAMNT_0003339007 /DNA_START=111 /DNA_END=260 /DNA_ORIENTATION=-
MNAVRPCGHDGLTKTFELAAGELLPSMFLGSSWAGCVCAAIMSAVLSLTV